MRRVLRGIGFLIALLLVAVGALYVGTMGEYPVPATVTDDPALPRIEVGGVTLHSESFGDPANPAIVVLHGGPGADYRSLLPLQALADSYHVTFYDQRGAGLSERVPAEALTLQTHLAELDGVLDLVSPDAPAILIGHSWGAMLASAFLGAHPDRVAAAVLIEPGFLSAVEAEAWGTRSQEIIRQPVMLWRGLRTGFESAHVDGPDEAAAQDYLIGRMMGYFASDPLTGYACPGESYDSPSWRAGGIAGQAVSSRAGPAGFDALGGNALRFSGPVLLIAGACSTWIGEDHQRGHLPLYSDARLAVIPDAGHDTVDDAPGAVLSEIRSFLGAGN
ncbi:alpha/beta fold hydrolase [Nioella sediminis]|jgi:proline iminopeptidase|uniref:alpha/beta fold hydrolase n=1 Tax=Nioella sediminis TaxID=1912092 RepID=UPI0008FD4D3C|nr:alpha/beta hydrolase [Nioella sediminis]